MKITLIVMMLMITLLMWIITVDYYRLCIICVAMYAGHWRACCLCGWRRILMTSENHRTTLLSPLCSSLLSVMLLTMIWHRKHVTSCQHSATVTVQSISVLALVRVNIIVVCDILSSESISIVHWMHRIIVKVPSVAFSLLFTVYSSLYQSNCCCYTK